jgi:multisubunit Na+/H+ antiporter MnhB subunit
MMSVAIIVTEVLITLKFDWETFTKPLPRHIVFGWVIGLVGLALWTVWHFYLQRLLTHTEQRNHENGHQGNAIQKSTVDREEICLNGNKEIRLRRNKIQQD